MIVMIWSIVRIVLLAWTAGNRKMILCMFTPATKLICSKEHQSRTPTCPFFVGLHGSLPASNASSPVKPVVTEPNRSKRTEVVDEDEAPAPKQSKAKRQMTRQSTFE